MMRKQDGGLFDNRKPFLPVIKCFRLFDKTKKLKLKRKLPVILVMVPELKIPVL